MDMRPVEEPPPPPRPRNAAISWLRFAVWLAPSGAVLALSFGLGFLGFSPSLGTVLPGVLVLAFGMGCYDGVLASPSRRLGLKSDCGASVVQHGIVFTFLQVIVVPFVALMLLFAMCGFGAL